MPRTRFFNTDRSFYLASKHPKIGGPGDTIALAAAMKRAAEIRLDGYCARIIETTRYYEVWTDAPIDGL